VGIDLEDEPEADESAIPDYSGVLVILPVLNEIEHIEVLLAGIHQQLARQAYTVLVIDDGSTDGTVAKIHALRIIMATTFNSCSARRYSAAHNAAVPCTRVWCGSDSHNHLVFVEMDGDLSHRPVS